jgi:protein subunit release factor A
MSRLSDDAEIYAVQQPDAADEAGASVGASPLIRVLGERSGETTSAMSKTTCRLSLRARLDEPEALAFQQDLVAMYQSWAQRTGRRLDAEMQETHEDAELLDLHFLVEGTDSYGSLVGETGRHRAQRVIGAEKPLATAIVRVAVFGEFGEGPPESLQERVRRTYHYQSGTATDHVTLERHDLTTVLAGVFD